MTPSGIEPATFRFLAQRLSHCATAVHLTKHRRIYSTKSPASGASSVSEPKLMSQDGRVRQVVRACVYAIRAMDAQYSSDDVVGEVT